MLLRRPIAALMITLVVVLLGGVAASRLPLALLPDFRMPKLEVVAAAPGRTAVEVETNVAGPLRLGLNNLNGLRDLQSTAQAGRAVIQLEYGWGHDMRAAYLDVQEALDRLRRQLPPEVPRPEVMPLAATDLPFLQLVYTDSFATDAETRQQFARNVLRRRFEQLPTLARCEILGERPFEIRVIPNLARLRELNLRAEDLGTMIEAANRPVGNLRLRDGAYTYTLTLNARLRTLNDVRALPVKVGSDRRLALGALAEVTYAPEPRQQAILSNGEAVLLLALYQRPDANLLEAREEVAESLASLRTDYPSLALEITDDQAFWVRQALGGLQQALLFGSLAAVALLFLSLRSWRAALIMASCIPISLLIAAGAFYLFGLSLNLLTLAGLTLGVGVLIDNAIIVVESIERLHRDLHSRYEAAQLAVQQLGLPLLASTLTTLCVFVPLAFSGELAGIFFADQAWAIALVLAASLLVSMGLLPVLYVRLFRKKAVEVSKPSSAVAWYERSVARWMRGYLPLLASFAALGLAFLPVGTLEREAFPQHEPPARELWVEWGSSVDAEENLRRSRAFAVFATEQFGVRALAYVGTYTRAQLSPDAAVFRLPADLRPEQQEALQFELSSRYPAARLRWRTPAGPFSALFPESPTNLRLYLDDLSGTDAFDFEGFRAWLAQRPEVEVLEVPYGEVERAYALEPDREALLRYGISEAELRSATLAALGRQRVTVLRAFDRETPVVLAARVDSLALRTRLARTFLPGRAVSLAAVTRVVSERQPVTVFAGVEGVRQRIDLRADKVPDLLRAVRAEARARGASVRATGSYFDEQALAKRLAGLLALAFILLYLVLAAQFESLVQPLIIVLTVPFGWGGAVLLLAATDQSLNLMSGIGLIVVSGIVVNDAILKVATINQLRRSGVAKRAAIARAGAVRLRPILLTSATTILAVLPIFLASGLGRDLQGPLAISVIGGMVGGTLASLWVLPGLYRVLNGN